MCAFQARAGADVTLLTCDARDVPWKEGEGGPRVRVLPRPGALAWQDKEFVRAAAAAVREADLVHLHVMWDPGAVALGRVARQLDRPYIQSAHGMLADWAMAQRRLKKAVFRGLV